MELEHFSHEHTLILNEEPEYNGEKVSCCNGCSSYIILGPSYNCSQLGCDFYLHKCCAELPKQIQHHPLHPKHPLNLLAYPLYGGDGNHQCDNCRETILNNFTYNCSLCNFDIDMTCALPLEHRIEETKSHQHPLIPLRRLALLLCDACGTEHKGIFYICNVCTESGVPFLIHKNCALLPTSVRHSGHGHLLNLAYSVPTEYSHFDPVCEICRKWLQPKYWVYYCADCKYFAHINCATRYTEMLEMGKKAPSKADAFMLILEPCENVNDSYSNPIHLPVLDESASLVSYLLGKLRSREKTKELDHFSHEHPLVLYDVQIEDESCSGNKLPLLNEKNSIQICNGCVQPILNPPFYSCAQCNFFLHKWCTELPIEVQHPCHPQHPLALLAKASTSVGLFRCQYCRHESNGFAFHCAICDVYVDVKCGLLPRAVTHDAHPEHVLLLREVSDDSWCNACRLPCISGFAFECTTCNFKLHVRCAQLPHTIRHRYDELHPFVHTYSPVKNHPLEYICEICEIEVDPKKWFYHCVSCDYSIHTTCTRVGDPYSNIKFGGTFDHETHAHQLSLVRNTKENSSCGHCGGDTVHTSLNPDISNPILECSQCNFKLHLRCACYDPSFESARQAVLSLMMSHQLHFLPA